MCLPLSLSVASLDPPVAADGVLCSFDGCVEFRGICAPSSSSAALSVDVEISCPGFCRQCCSEHWGALYVFLQIHAQEGDG